MTSNKKRAIKSNEHEKPIDALESDKVQTHSALSLNLVGNTNFAHTFVGGCKNSYHGSSTPPGFTVLNLPSSPAFKYI